MESFLDNSIKLSEKSQEKLNRLGERIIFKEKLFPAIAKVYEDASPLRKILAERQERIIRYCDCGKYLGIDAETGEIRQANFCKQRLCPVCNYIKSSITWHKVKQVAELIKSENELEFIFMTLTVKNCDAELLSENIDNMLSSFNRLRSRKKWQKVILGAIRGLEITYNENTNQFHPHIHIVCAVEKEYFNKSNPDYITIGTLRQWWQESARLDYFVQVDIRKVDNEDNAIAEISKYAVKMAEVLKADSEQSTIDAVKTLYRCTFNRRLIATLGIFKKAMRLLNLGELDDFDIEENYERASARLIWRDSKFVDERSALNDIYK